MDNGKLLGHSFQSLNLTITKCKFHGGLWQWYQQLCEMWIICLIENGNLKWMSCSFQCPKSTFHDVLDNDTHNCRWKRSIVSLKMGTLNARADSWLYTCTLTLGSFEHLWTCWICSILRKVLSSWPMPLPCLMYWTTEHSSIILYFVFQTYTIHLFKTLITSRSNSSVNNFHEWSMPI